MLNFEIFIKISIRLIRVKTVYTLIQLLETFRYQLLLIQK